jgi:hypothetical protein
MSNISISNGRVLLVDELYNERLLAVLPKKPAKQLIKLKDVPNYHVYEIQDGSVITLYYVAELTRWLIATYTSYDISNYRRFSDLKYIDAIRETLILYPKFNWDKLDKDKCYTLCFSHPAFHPLQKQPSMSYIQCYDLLNSTYVVQNIGIPEQSTITISNPSNMIKSLNNTLHDYLRGQKPNFGYLLVDKTKGMNDKQIILMESKLMKTVRQLVYNIPKKMTLNCELYITLKAFLSIHNRLFIRLFPQYKSTFDKYYAFINDLTKDIIDNHDYLEADLTTRRELRTMFSTQLRAIDISINSDSKPIIIDYLMNTVNLDIFMEKMNDI